KCLLEFGEGNNVLEHIIERARRGGLTPVIATTELPEDDAIVEIASQRAVMCFRGSVRDKLRRWRDACRHFGLRDFHTVDADDPFFDPALGIASLGLLRSGRYDIVYPSTKSYLASM